MIRMVRRTVVSDILSETKGAGLYSRYPDISDRKKWEALSRELKKNADRGWRRGAKRALDPASYL
jgi:hypothetical protein